MIDVEPQHMNSICRILAEHLPQCEVRAFGSRVCGSAKDYSDLDLAIVGRQTLDADMLRHLVEAFQESDLPFRVDVLDWHAVSEKFQTIISRRYKILQSANEPNANNQ